MGLRRLENEVNVDGFYKTHVATVASIVSAALSAGATMLPKAKDRDAVSSLFVTPLPMGMGSSSPVQSPGSSPRG